MKHKYERGGDGWQGGEETKHRSSHSVALRNDDRLTPELRNEMAMIERNVRLEAWLIDDLLDVTRTGNGKLLLHREWSDANSLILLAIEIVREEALAKGLKIETRFAAPLSGVSVDTTRFQQVVWNLLRNAVKFTPANGRISVVTSNIGSAENCALRIEVSDSGIGIELDCLEKIFSPFEQADSARVHQFGGLGLGLAIARAITDLHGETIWAESEGLNRGSRFTIELPGAGKILPIAPGSTGRVACRK